MGDDDREDDRGLPSRKGHSPLGCTGSSVQMEKNQTYSPFNGGWLHGDLPWDRIHKQITKQKEIQVVL